MKHPIISAIATIALLAAATMLWPHTPPTKVSASTATMPSLQALHSAANVTKLPDQEIEDQSVIFSGMAKR